MYKKLFLIAIIFSTMLFVLSCEKDPVVDTTPPPPAPPPKSFVEEFDSVGNLGKAGWAIINNSYPIGGTSWRQGLYSDIAGFPAFSAVYSPNEFVSIDFYSAAGAATISSWLITRQMVVKNGDVLSFYTKSKGRFVDRMQVRANYTNGSGEVGNTPQSVGDFTSLLLDINSGMTTTGYPAAWTKYTITISGLGSTVVNARFAFRYFLTNAGPLAPNGDMIGIDKMEFVSK